VAAVKVGVWLVVFGTGGCAQWPLLTVLGLSPLPRFVFAPSGLVTMFYPRRTSYPGHFFSLII
jgi:hypothetical protein